MQGQMERTGAAARPWDPVRGSRRTLAALVSAVWICLLAATPLMAALAPQGTVDALARQIEALYSRAPDLEETFDQGADDWYDDGDIYRYDATGGNFRLRIRKPNSLHWIRYDKSTELALADYLVEVVALPVPLRSSGSYGLIFRFQDDNNYYLFALSGRYYSLQAYVQGQWSFLVDWTESPAIEARWDMPNRLGVLAQGSQIVLLINDQIVAAVEDDAIPMGGVGLAAYTFESGVMEVAFDDLAIWQLGTAPASQSPSAADPMAARLVAIRSQEPLYSQDFSLDDGSWPTGADDRVSASVVEGAYHMAVTTPQLLAWNNDGYLSTLDLDDFLAEVDVRVVHPIPSSGYGLVFRARETSRLYAFWLSDDRYELIRMDGSGQRWTWLQPLTPSTAIRLEEGAVNRLGVLAEGDTITLLINDTVVFQTQDDTLATGRVGLAVSTNDVAGIEVAFDNLTVWPLRQGDESEEATRIEPQTDPSSTPSAVAWGTYDGDAFTLRHPRGWTVQSSDDGRVELQGNGSEQVVIWPLYVARAVDTPQAQAILQALAQAQRPDLRWARGTVVSAGLVRQVGRSDTQTGVAGLAWVSDGAQSALFFYLVAAPTAHFEAQTPLFATILRSFQVQSTGQEPAPMPARLDFVPFTDPMEGAFHVEVPAGWETKGGLYRAAAVDVRPWLRTRSPDQAILVFAGDPQVPTFSLPSEISSWLGWQEGDWYSPGYGVQMMISRYLPGEEFAAAYVTRWMDLPGCVIQEKVPLTQLEETLNQLLIQNGLLLPGQRQDMGYVTFTCPSEGQPVTGFLLVQTTLLEMYGTGIWQVTVLTGFLASPERVGEASAVMAHLTSTWRTDPRWYAAQQQTTAAVSDIVTTTSQEIAAIVNQVYEQAQQVQDRLAEDYARALRGVEDVQDPRTGEVYQVQSSSNYYWIDPQGNIVGTNAYFNPDGLRFEEMLRLP